MKKRLLIMLFCISFYANAQQIQTDESITYTQEASKGLKPLIEKDAKLYKNSILYDKVMPLANLSEFNNSPQALTHPVLFKRAWQELYSARVSKSDKHISVKELEAISNHYQQQGIIQLGIINTDFTQLKESIVAEIQEKKTSITKLAKRNEPLAKSKTPIETPYENKHVFMVSPLTNHAITTFSNTNVQFEIGQLGLNQSTQKIKSLNVVYKDKTTSLILNSKLTKPKFTQRFTSSGVKEMQFNAVFTNGKTLSHKAKFTVAIKTAARRGHTAIKKIRANQPFRGYDEPSDCNGDCYGEGEYQVFLGKDNSKLNKPVIILDGFDPGDLRKIEGGSGSIVKLIDNDFKEENMDKFYQESFDVVILNFPKRIIGSKTVKYWHPWLSRYIYITIQTERDGGSDYVERNANVLKALIVELNEKLQENGSNEKLKIIGPSMGGLISRVALTEMEKANQNHNVDIWVSFDSPHLGANIPVGFQYFFNFMELDQVEALKTPAAKQMLITQVVDQTYATRSKFRSKLSYLGFPKKTRNLALINGSINGKRTGTPKGKMLYVDFQGLGTIFGSVFRYQINTFASHDGGRHRIFERYKRTLFWKNRHNAYLNDNTGKGSLDNSPGGYYDFKNEFETSLGVTLPLTNWNAGSALNTLLSITDKPAKTGAKILVPIVLFALNSSIYLDVYQGKPSFIPSKSALAFTGSNKLLHENLSSRNLVCTNETPFDSYYAPNENEEHITLNSKNMAWVLEELKGNKQPVFPNNIPSIVISGNDTLCNGQTATYTINNCSSAKVTWSTSSSLQVLSSNNQQITVENNNSNTINTWLKVTLPNGQSVSKNILGKPSISYKVEHDKYSKISIYGVEAPINQQGISSTKWVQTGGNGTLITNNFFPTYFSTYAKGSGINWYVTGEVRVTNSCGTTTKSFYIRSSVNPCDDIRFEKFAKNQYRIIRPCDRELLRYENVQLTDLYGNTKNIPNQNGVINLENTSPKGTIRVLKVNSKEKIKSKMIIMD